MTDNDHPLVQRYMRQFDEAAGALPVSRRIVLREEILSHLRDAVAGDASDADAAAVIAGLGSPAEIVAQELDGQPLPARRSGWELARRVMTILAIIGFASDTLLVLVLEVLAATQGGVLIAGWAYLTEVAAIIGFVLVLIARRHPVTTAGWKAVIVLTGVPTLIGLTPLLLLLFQGGITSLGPWVTLALVAAVIVVIAVLVSRSRRRAA